MNEENKLARKVPLESLLNYLSELFELGVDYVDITGQLGEEHDMIGIIFCEEYMDEEFKGNFEFLTSEFEQPGEAFNPDDIDDII